jgi:HAD superfamily hydrolase (TIGR01549 family)
MKNQLKQHFVFDLDDTLVDARQFCGETVARVITKYFPKTDYNFIIHLHEVYRGASIPVLYKTILKDLKIREKSYKKLLKKMLEDDARIQINECDKINIFDGVIDILNFLKSKNKGLHVCTNRPLITLGKVLEKNNLKQYFDTIISCADEGHKKPEPQCYYDIISKNGGNKEAFIYFGDSEIDAEFAKNSGTDFIIFDQYLNEKNLFKKLINLFLEDKMNGDKTK